MLTFNFTEGLDAKLFYSHSAEYPFTLQTMCPVHGSHEFIIEDRSDLYALIRAMADCIVDSLPYGEPDDDSTEYIAQYTEIMDLLANYDSNH